MLTGEELTFGQARGPEGVQIDTLRRTLGNPFRHALADRRARFEVGAAVSQNAEESLVRRQSIDDGVTIRAHGDDPRPSTAHEGVAQRWPPGRAAAARIDDVVEIDTLVVEIGVDVELIPADTTQGANVALWPQPGVVRPVDVDRMRRTVVGRPP